MRRPRLDYPGARHHLMNRGSRRGDIFFGSETRELFLSLLSGLPRRFGLRIHAYALMPNHYHLLIESNGTLSAAMQHLGASYVRQLNRRKGWDGPLFRGRFLNKVVQSDAHWAHLPLYLHLNPVRAQLPSDHLDWTSHAAYLGLVRNDWLTTGELLDHHAGPSGYAEAFEAVRCGERAPPPSFDADRLWEPHETGIFERPHPKRGHTPDDAIADVQLVTGLARSQVLAPQKGAKGNPARWLAAWWMAKLQIPRAAIKHALNSRYNNVHRMIERVERRRAYDARLAGWTMTLERDAGARERHLLPDAARTERSTRPPFTRERGSPGTAAHRATGNS